MTQPPMPPPLPQGPGSTGVPFDASAEQLASLAQNRPDLWSQILNHPNCYDGLRSWITANGGAVDASSDAGSDLDSTMTAASFEEATRTVTADDFDHTIAANDFERTTVADGFDQGAAGVSSESAVMDQAAQLPPPNAWAPPAAAPRQSVPQYPAPQTPMPPPTLAMPAVAAAGTTPDRAGRTKPKSKVWLAAVVAAALVISGGGVALVLTDTWPFGQNGSSSASASNAAQVTQQKEGPTFADGVEEKWTLDAASLGGNLMMGGWGGRYPRGFQFDGPTKWYPKSIYDAVLVPIWDDQRKNAELVLLDSTDGSNVWSTRLEDRESTSASPGTGCEVGAGLDRIYCGVSDGDDTQLLVIDASGEFARTPLDGHFSDITTDEFGVSLMRDDSTVRLDLDGTLLWDSTTTVVASQSDLTLLDTAQERTLVRSFPGGWELFDKKGKSLASVAGHNGDEGGIGYLSCDAAIAGDRLFLFGDCDSSLTAAGMSVTQLDEVPQHRMVYSGDPSVLVVASTSDVSAYDSSTGDQIWSHPSVLWFSSGEQFDQSQVALYDGAAALSLVSISSGEVQGAVDLPASSTVKTVRGGVVTLAGTRSTTLSGFASSGGEARWSVDQGPNMSLLGNSSGILLTEFSPETDSDSKLTLLAPANTVASVSTAGGIEIPNSISVGCPADTTLLAWAEFTDGWVLVCGVSMNEPTFMAYQGPGSSQVLYSVGAQKPTSADAKAAVNWDAGLSRYSAELDGGDRVTLDYDIGTAVRRDSADRTTVEQQRFIRYVFVPISEKVRTVSETSKQDGAFDVQAPDDTAEDQVRYMIEVLEKAYAGRALVKDALPKLEHCTASAGGYSDTVSAMKAVRDNRAELLSALDAMPVDKIPEGSALLDDLYDAIEASHRANIEYVAWAEGANASGCASLSGTGAQAAADSDPPKERFASRWNRAVAPAFGVRSFDAWYI